MAWLAETRPQEEDSVKSAMIAITEELRRILDEYDRIGAECERLTTERKNRQTIAWRLIHILYAIGGSRAVSNLLEETGLASRVATLPRLPGRRPSGEIEDLAERVGEAAGALPSGTRVRMISGKYNNWTGVIRWHRRTGRTVTYTVHLEGPSGQKARTQVGHGAIGRSFEILEGPEETTLRLEEPRMILRRRDGTVRPVRSIFQEMPAQVSNLVLRETEYRVPTQGVVEKGTPVMMMVGKFLGYTGTVVSVNLLRTDPKIDAIYTLSLQGPDGTRGRTTVKHSSLGRTWRPISKP